MGLDPQHLVAEAVPKAANSNRTVHHQLQFGPYVLRTLLDNVPLSEDGENANIKINCVDYLGGNLYIGTSASELLHFVQVPPVPTDIFGQSAFILASRLRPGYAESSVAGHTKPGVQQILLLSQVQKACVLCNNTVTFYSLPELSPMFGTVRVKNCYWIGGLNLNQLGNGTEAFGEQRPAGETIMLSLARKIQVVRVGADARVFKQIDFAESTISVRRDAIACVADSRNYALLDIDRQLKIPLMSISSLDDSQPNIRQAQNIAGNSEEGILRSSSSAQPRPGSSGGSEPYSHSRSTSLGGFMSQAIRRQGNNASDGFDSDVQGSDSPRRTGSPANQGSQAPGSADKSLPGQTDAAGNLHVSGPVVSKSPPVILKPHIVSPTPEEFLLVTGTGPRDPGIGIFVNLDGEPTRPTLDFDKYPKQIVVDGGIPDLTSSRASFGEEGEGYVLASTFKEIDGVNHAGLEIQRLDLNVGEDEANKFWLAAPTSSSEDEKNPTTLGIRSLRGSEDSHFPEIMAKLCQTKFSLFSADQLEASVASPRTVTSRSAFSTQMLNEKRELLEQEEDDSPLPAGWEATRNEEEEVFVKRFAKVTARLAVWSGNRLWWAVRNPLLLQLDARVASVAVEGQPPPHILEQRRELFSILATIRGRDAKTELEFMTFNYIRQRASVLLFAGFLHAEESPFPPELMAMEQVLIESNLDPRIIIGLVPGLRNEIIESKKGIWIFGGVKGTVERYMASQKFGQIGHAVGDLEEHILLFIKSYLWSARRKKGLASFGSEGGVFQTVEAALLVVLLELDKNSPPGPGKNGSIRSELNDLVDNGVDCFDRAVHLLESYHRLFVLSRLYQSRKMAADVLHTWKRIIEGEQDNGNEMRDGELRVREYLSKISSRPLVQEYGVWLANRNPKLGVQVFAEDKGRSPKFESTEAVDILRQQAPAAVKYYLEHLVFDKGHTAYINELVTYYLDVVIDNLLSSPQARDAVVQTYEAYRALRSPKPSYRQFLRDNAPPEAEVWHSRLRLLQLLGDTHEYDFKAIRARIAQALPASNPEEQLLVPEIIILDGREHRHEEALRLLVHRLSDYDTAVSYCLRGDPGRRRRRHRGESMASQDSQQAVLFRALLREFLAIQDVADRVEQTGALLQRFGACFDVEEVLAQIPDSWSVDVVAGFLVTALRRLVAERHQTEVAVRLSSAENLRVNWELVVKIEEGGPTVEAGN